MYLSLVTDSPHLTTPTPAYSSPGEMASAPPSQPILPSSYHFPGSWRSIPWMLFCPDGSSLIMLTGCRGPASVVGGQFDIEKIPSWVAPSGHSLSSSLALGIGQFHKRLSQGP